MTLETIYSVGEGRTVVVAVDGCSSCIEAFDEFVKDRQELEDRIVVVVKGGRPKMAQGKYSGPLLLSGTAKARAKASSGSAAEGFPAGTRRPDCRVRNRVVVPDQPLEDFSDWDRTSRAVLTKLAARAAKHETRFEAIRVLAGGRPQHFIEAVVECCQELEANLLVVGSHSSSAPGQGRSLSAVFAAHTGCPILVLGRRKASSTPQEDDQEGEEGDEEDVQEVGEVDKERPQAQKLSSDPAPASSIDRFIRLAANKLSRKRSSGAGESRPASAGGRSKDDMLCSGPSSPPASGRKLSSMIMPWKILSPSPSSSQHRKLRRSSSAS